MKRNLFFVFLATLLSLSEQTFQPVHNETLGSNVKGNLSVPDGYQYFPGVGYYKMNDRRESFGSARRLCEADGAHLGIINSLEEALAIFELYKPYFAPGVGGVRLGFGDFFEKGELRTIFGEPLSSTGYKNWYPGKPNFLYDRNCGSMNIEIKLMMASCEYPRYYVCEIEL